jgi:cobalt/nickel transport system permease protein
LLVAMFGLMWRYLFILADEALRLMRARAARSGAPEPGRGRRPARSGGSLAWRARVTGGMAGNLFLRAFERSERIFIAMLSRGYDGEVRTLALTPLARGPRLTLIAGLGLLAILLGTGLLLWS